MDVLGACSLARSRIDAPSRAPRDKAVVPVLLLLLLLLRLRLLRLLAAQEGLRGEVRRLAERVNTRKLELCCA